MPNNKKGPFPTFVGMNFRGSYVLLDDPRVHLPTEWMMARLPGTVNNRATEVGRGTQIETWALDQSVARGYAVATFYDGEIDPDKNDFTDGVHPFFYKKGQTKPGPHEWGTIAAWAWGISRAVDYLVTDPNIDKTRIAAIGHSRLGKTALLAAVLDERIAMAIPDKAGCGGSAPSRTKNPKAETVKAINRSFPHWFNDTFKAFNDQPDKLPFDQNCLVAMMAPRPVLFSNATEDQWADPPGQFEVLKAAEPVYKLLGAGGLDAKEFPPENKLIDSKLGYYVRPGKHLFTREDWAVYLDFADKHFGRK
jgi:dienelactone hydrolase